MAEIKKIDASKAVTMPLSFATKGSRTVGDALEKLDAAEKYKKVVNHDAVTKIAGKRDYLWTALGLVLIFHGAQFKNLFLCTQVVMFFCYGRVKGSVLALYTDLTTAKEKLSGDAKPEETSEADAKAEAAPPSKHAQKRAAKKEGEKAAPTHEEDAAEAKKLLKVLNTDKVSAAAFELCVTAMACHMVMEGGLFKVAVVTQALVRASKERINGFLEFADHQELEAWTDLFLSFVLYTVFGGMALILSPLAFAINIASCGAQLIMDHGLRVAQSMGKIPEEQSAETFAASTKGLAILGGITVFGTFWQFWAIVAESGMAWYFSMLYLPAVIVEAIIGLF